MWLLLFRWALRWLPFRCILGWLARPAVCSALLGAERALVRECVADAVSYAIHRIGVEATCFPSALAAHAMLRRRGVDSSLIYGARRLAGPPKALHAHVWLRDGAVGVVGHHAAAQLGLPELVCLAGPVATETNRFLCMKSLETQSDDDATP